MSWHDDEQVCCVHDYHGVGEGSKRSSCLSGGDHGSLRWQLQRPQDVRRDPMSCFSSRAFLKRLLCSLWFWKLSASQGATLNERN